MTTALLIIDMQRALCTGEEAAFGIDQVLARINGLIARARAAAVPIVLVQHEEDEGSLRHGSEGWQLADGLDVQAGDGRVRKTRPDSFHDTQLRQLLDDKDVQRLVVCGLQSDFCVNATTRRAVELGYSVTLVADGHSTVDNGGRPAAGISADHNRTLATIGPRIEVVPAATVSLR